MNKAFMKISFILSAIFVILTVIATSSHAQYSPPILNGPGIIKREGQVACMSPKQFQAMLQSGNYEIIFTNGSSEDPNLIKMILANSSGEIIVANIVRSDEVCVVDVFEKETASRPPYSFKFLQRQDNDE